MKPQTPTARLEQHTEGGLYVIPLTHGSSCRFGREATNTVVLSDELVSRYHAVIDCHETGRYVLTDVGSRNGTLLNGSIIRRPTQLADGDEITIGPFVFTFRAWEPTSPHARPVPPIQATVVELSTGVITVVVTDIRGFTGWARRVHPDSVATFMSALFSEADEILARNRVWAHKFIGDAIMAVWRHGQGTDTEVLQLALTGIVELFDALDRINSRLLPTDPLRMGAAVNTGIATLGNLGSGRIVDHTALGDSVNKAFRLEAATRSVDCDLLLGSATYERLEPGWRDNAFEKISVTLKGYEHPQHAWCTSVARLRRMLSQHS